MGEACAQVLLFNAQHTVMFFSVFSNFPVHKTNMRIHFALYFAFIFLLEDTTNNYSTRP